MLPQSLQFGIGKKTLVIPLRSDAREPIRVRKNIELPTDRVYLFLPSEGVNAEVHLLSAVLPYIVARNDVDTPLRLSRRTKVGTVQEADSGFLYRIEVRDEEHQDSNSTESPCRNPNPADSPKRTDTLYSKDTPREEPKRTREQAESRGLIVGTDPGKECKLPNGITMYEDTETGDKLAELLNEFEDVFTEGPGFVEYPEDEWMRIRMKPGAQWPKKVTRYPLGAEGQIGHR